jgi:hypothetical protein
MIPALVADAATGAGFDKAVDDELRQDVLRLGIEGQVPVLEDLCTGWSAL